MSEEKDKKGKPMFSHKFDPDFCKLGAFSTKDEIKKKKKKCPDHQVQYQGGDPNHSDFGCKNCDDDQSIVWEDAGTGA